jgi:hypothetical protein
MSLSLVLIIFFAVAVSGATISVERSFLTVPPGDSFTLDVGVSSIADLYAFQFDLAFS